MSFDYTGKRRQSAGVRTARGGVYGPRQRRPEGPSAEPVKYEEDEYEEDYDDMQDPDLEDEDLDYNMEPREVPSPPKTRWVKRPVAAAAAVAPARFKKPGEPRARPGGTGKLEDLSAKLDLFFQKFSALDRSVSALKIKLDQHIQDTTNNHTEVISTMDRRFDAQIQTIQMNAKSLKSMLKEVMDKLPSQSGCNEGTMFNFHE